MAKAKEEQQSGASDAMVKARVLTRIYVDGVAVEPDAVIELPAEQLAYYVATGEVDRHPDAVAYAEAAAAEAAKNAAGADGALEA